MKFPKNTIQMSGVKYEPNIGSWGSVIKGATSGLQVRKRKGLHYNFDYYGSESQYPSGRVRNPYSELTPDQMWQIYQNCSDVRAAVDSIVRRVATYDWNVVPTIDPKNPRYLDLKNKCEDIKNFFNTPNSNGYTFQEILTSMLTDALVFDSGVFEIVYDRAGNLKELVPLRGASIVPLIDEHGRITQYVQDIMSEGQGFYGNVNIIGSEGVGKSGVENVFFKTNQILFLSLFPNTSNPSGNPLLESLVNEVISVMRASQHAMLALDADEIPPGILVLAGIAGKAAEQAKADLRTLKGQDHKIRVMTTPDPQGMAANWLELRRTPKDISMRELVEDIRRSIYRVFGVQPVEMGMTEGMPRATAHVQLDVSTSHLVTPILELLQGKLNNQIIPLLVEDEDDLPFIQFVFDRESRLPPEERNRVANAHQVYIKNGIMSRNEVRDELGLLPVEGGDVLTLEVAGMPTSLKAVVENTVYPVKIANQEKEDDVGETPSEEVSLSLDSESVGDIFFEKPGLSTEEPFKVEDTANEDQLDQDIDDLIEKSKFGIYEDISSIKNDDIKTKLKGITPKYLNASIPFIPYPDDFNTVRELEYLKSIQKDYTEEELKFFERADKTIGLLFIELLNDEGFLLSEDQKDDIERVLVDTTIPVLKLKYLYNRPRPYQVAEHEGIEFNALGSESAKTPSYPSGHATQSMYLAYHLSKTYPEITDKLFKLAKKISWSRVMAGLHFPSDINFGNLVYKYLIAQDRISGNLEYSKKDYGKKSNASAAMKRLPSSTQKTLKNKGKEHNDKFGDVKSKRLPNVNYLAVSYHRGIGAYNTSPASVRPSVKSAEQWAMGRVNGLLYALRNGKFKRKPYDTDLLPKEHPFYNKEASIDESDERHVLYKWKRLKKAPNDTDWGFDDKEAEKILGESNDMRLYERAFLFVDKGRTKDPKGYRLPIAKMIDGELQIVFRGVIAAGSALRGSDKHNTGYYNLRGASDRDVKILYDIVKSLYRSFGEVAPAAPWEDKEIESAVGDTDPTNFPSRGDDKKVSLRNSEYPLFPKDYAEKIKNEYPSIWAKGGNIKGNDQYSILTKIRDDNNGSPETPSQEAAIRRREAWAARHLKDYLLNGTVAQMKWLVIGERGLSHMKDIINEAIDKLK